MRTFVALIIVAGLTGLAGCTKPNPNVCCVTPEQCTSLGIGDMRPCEAGQACSAGSCVASECDTSADCTSPADPICINHLCVGSCSVDADCMGVTGKPLCASDGVCVGCLDATQCSADAAICDATDRACRGCENDDECASGVCLEADGVCAPEASVVYVASNGQDQGECTKGSPCQTLAYGFAKSAAPQRRVIHLAGGMANLGTSPFVINHAVYIDATNTLMAGGDPVIRIASQVGRTTLAHVAFASSSGTAVDVVSGSLRVFDGDVRSKLTVNATTLEISSSNVANTAVDCANGTLTVHRSLFEQASLGSSGCALTVSRSRFRSSPGDATIRSGGGLVLYENNVFIAGYEYADFMAVTAAAPGSAVRFNTFVNTSGVDSDGTALGCDGTAEVTSNVFAYRSRHPHAYSLPFCPTQYSLYDTVALPFATSGVGSKVADGDTFFLDRAGGDYRLAPGSPGKGIADPGLALREDFGGAPRPQPAGSVADVGAYEAP